MNYSTHSLAFKFWYVYIHLFIVWVRRFFPCVCLRIKKLINWKDSYMTTLFFLHYYDIEYFNRLWWAVFRKFLLIFFNKVRECVDDEDIFLDWRWWRYKMLLCNMVTCSSKKTASIESWATSLTTLKVEKAGCNIKSPKYIKLLCHILICNMKSEHIVLSNVEVLIWLII